MNHPISRAGAARRILAKAVVVAASAAVVIAMLATASAQASPARTEGGAPNGPAHDRDATGGLALGGAWTQTAELDDPGGATNDWFGTSVALSSDGTTALVGAPGRNSFTGVAYVFSRVLTQRGGSWTQTAELEALDGVLGDTFGVSAALSGDGTTALVGANGHKSGAGAAYLLAQSGGSWSQTAELEASDGALNDTFGNSVALSSDGTTALVGAPWRNSLTGVAYVFAQNGGSWSQTAEVEASDGAPNDTFGFSVALSSDGTTALVGAPRKNSNTGTAYVFTESGSSWSQTAELEAPGGAPNDYFGWSLALSSDGTTALVGASRVFLPGAVYVFAQSGGSWSQTAELQASDGAPDDYFGQWVALSSEGMTALVGAPQLNFHTGAAYVFMKTGARLVFRPASGPPGSTTRLLGGGFTPGETVDISIGNHPSKATANSKGKFSLKLEVPAGAKSGQKVRATAKGETSGLSAKATFTVT